MDKTIDMAREAGILSEFDTAQDIIECGIEVWLSGERGIQTLECFAALVRTDERKAVLDTIDELMGMERDRHPMFSDGYDHALQHIAQFVRGRGNA